MYISYSVPFVLYKRTRRRRLLICCPSIAAHQQRTSHTHTHTRKKKKLIHFFFYLFFFSIFIFLVFLAIQARAFLDSLALKFFQSSSLFPSLPRVNQYLPPRTAAMATPSGLGELENFFFPGQKKKLYKSRADECIKHLFPPFIYFFPFLFVLFVFLYCIGNFLCLVRYRKESRSRSRSLENMKMCMLLDI